MSSTTTTTTPFDVDQLQNAADKADPQPEPTFVTADDGVQLAVRIYSPKPNNDDNSASKQPTAIMVFYHGGGAHSAAGYQILANRLGIDYGIKVYTPDIRGHGQSEGPRGDSPSPEQIFRDIDTVLDFAKKENSSFAESNSSTIPMFLAGHSSGAGLMIQYATTHNSKTNQRGRDDDITGYLLVAPQLGPNAKVDKSASWPNVLYGFRSTLYSKRYLWYHGSQSGSTVSIFRQGTQ